MNKDVFEAFLATLIKDDKVINEAMNYSLMAPGKRLRPLLLLELLEDFGEDPKKGLHAASAIEMIHTYSLIHDDLPAMDNDDYRRGRLTNHKKFGEATGILAGDGLLTMAFEVASESNISPEKTVKVISRLAKYAGHEGMIQGQMLDMEYTDNEDVTIEQLKETDYHKTGDLLALPLVSACIIAGKEEYIEMFDKIGHELGVAFQIQDDVLDFTSGADVMGKSTSDKDNNKSTYYTLLGEEKATSTYVEMYENIFNELGNDTQFSFENTRNLIMSMKDRKK